MNQRLQNSGWAILYALAAWMVLWTVLQLADDVELYTNPVVKDFKVTSMTRVPGGVVLYGTVNKLRDCKTIGLTVSRVYADGAQGLVAVDYSKDGGKQITTRPTGMQQWGPWVASIPDAPTTISIAVRHACNPLYDLQTKLITFEVTP